MGLDPSELQDVKKGRIHTVCRQFACEPCDNSWWRRVPSRKQVYITVINFIDYFVSDIEPSPGGGGSNPHTWAWYGGSAVMTTGFEIFDSIGSLLYASSTEKNQFVTKIYNLTNFTFGKDRRYLIHSELNFTKDTHMQENFQII